MNTTETNKKFAEFLEREVNEIEMIAPEQLRVSIPFEHSKGYFTTTIFKHSEAKFHNDWNWLMLVLEAIHKTNDASIQLDLKNIVTISFGRETKHFFSSDLIGNVYEACNAFIDWYNSNKG